MFGEKLDLVVVAEGGVFQLGFGFVQGVEVAAAGEEQAFAFALPAYFLQQRVFEQIETRAGFGGQADDGVRAGLREAVWTDGDGFAGQVGFVVDFDFFYSDRKSVV